MSPRRQPSARAKLLLEKGTGSPADHLLPWRDLPGVLQPCGFVMLSVRKWRNFTLENGYLLQDQTSWRHQRRERPWPCSPVLSFSWGGQSVSRTLSTESLPSEDVSLCSGSSLCPWAILRAFLLAGGKTWRGCCCLSRNEKEMREMGTCRAPHKQQNKSLLLLWPGELCISAAGLPQHGAWSPARWPVNFLTVRE